ncbi:MAG: hypothetical protein LUH15_12575 [Tannerellaceae bacterium]|nr:hypothetical protein [Tannerellaceae bacterium]
MLDDFYDAYIDDFDEEDFESINLREYEDEMKIQFMNDALAELENMAEQEACTFYHTDSKEEARQGIIEYWTWLA